MKREQFLSGLAGVAPALHAAIGCHELDQPCLRDIVAGAFDGEHPLGFAVVTLETIGPAKGPAVPVRIIGAETHRRLRQHGAALIVAGIGEGERQQGGHVGTAGSELNRFLAQRHRLLMITAEELQQAEKRKSRWPVGIELYGPLREFASHLHRGLARLTPRKEGVEKVRPTDARHSTRVIGIDRDGLLIEVSRRGVVLGGEATQPLQRLVGQDPRLKVIRAVGARDANLLSLGQLDLKLDENLQRDIVLE